MSAVATEAGPFKSLAARTRYQERYELRAKAWPVPSSTRFVETSFGRTFVRESGPENGTKVLLLPGIGSPGLSLAALVKRLAPRLRTFAIDNIHDNGLSEETKPVTSGADFATWIDEVARGLGLEQVNLIGLSYGGWISTQYALHFPERVGRVVLLAPAGTTADIPFGFIWRAILSLLPGKFFMRRFMVWSAPQLELNEEGRRIMEELVDDAVLAMHSFKRRQMVAPLKLSDDDWKRYRAKTLFLAGDREVMFPPHEAIAKLKALAPQVEAELLPDAGHDFFVARADEVAARILRFFE